MTIQEEVTKVSTTCPICKSKRLLEIPDSIINDKSQLTTISLPKGLICDHHFQMFIDKNFKVRGYQKVDFEIKLGSIDENISETKYIDSAIKDEKDLFKNLLKDGNYLEYRPEKSQVTTSRNSNVRLGSLKRDTMTLEDIYEEFWEFIEDDNPEFEDHIQKDKRRIKY